MATEASADSAHSSSKKCPANVHEQHKQFQWECHLVDVRDMLIHLSLSIEGAVTDTDVFGEGVEEGGRD